MLPSRTGRRPGGGGDMGVLIGAFTLYKAGKTGAIGGGGGGDFHQG